MMRVLVAAAGGGGGEAALIARLGELLRRDVSLEAPQQVIVAAQAAGAP